MNNLTAADYEDFRIDTSSHRGDFSTHEYVDYSVVGVYTDYWGETSEDVLIDSLSSRQFAEAWLRVYLEKEARDRFFDGPRDC